MINSIKDIARAAGVSHSTVSRALSDSPLVSADTKVRIRRLAREMGYSPDARARSLVKGRTCTVGVVVTSIADPLIAEVVQGVEATACTHDYNVLLASSRLEPAHAMAAVEMFRSNRVDAVIVISSQVSAFYLDAIGHIGVPVVLVNGHSLRPNGRMLSVSVDNEQGGYMATRHLLELGHRRIAYIQGLVGRSPCADRMRGYLGALREAGCERDPDLIVQGTGRAQGGERALMSLRDLPDPPTAVFCYNDMTAIGVLQAGRRAGLAVPRDLAVVGFDDIPFASYVSPALTTVAQPKAELGREAMEMALRVLAGEEVADRTLQGQLVIRESSAC
jgi:DNA-binding LacI/PurR family transcriptional regulator